MSKTSPLAIIILAAGKGTRMKSALPKVMHKLAGRPMIGWVMETAQALDPEKVITVIAPDQEMIKEEVAPHPYAYQEKQLGTAHAVQQAKEELKEFNGTVLVLYGDGPLYTPKTLRHFLKNIENAGAEFGFLGMTPEDPTGYGRMSADENGYITNIIEEKDANEAQKKIGLCWTGVMAGKASSLFELIEQIDNNNAQNEYYLTSLPRLAASEGLKTIHALAPIDETLGVNSRAELAALEAKMQERLRMQAMDNGATLIDPASTFLSFDTKIGQDVIIEPNVMIGPGVTIADETYIYAFSHIEGAAIEKGAQIGPFARVRPKSSIGEKAVVGNFIEVNRSTVQAGAKSKHMSYLGDAVIGEKANIGAGTVIANYDGFNKHKTIIGTGAFIGTNSTIIAPVTIGDGAIVAAGSSITHDVPGDAMGIARARQENRDGWAAIYRGKKLKTKKTG